MRWNLLVENWHGIKFSLSNQLLIIEAKMEDYYLSIWDGVCNVMNRSGFGRTAVFTEDCKYISCDNERIYLQVLPGTASYVKELAKYSERKISELWHKQLEICKLR